MSLVTRCPSCATTFKVVRDQLRISDGWVRCGRCSQVFDATADLRETPDQGAPAAVPQDDAGAPPDADPSAAAPRLPEPEAETESEPEPEPEPEPIFEFRPAWMAAPSLEADPPPEPAPLPALDRPPFLPSGPSAIDLLPADFLTIDLPPAIAPTATGRPPVGDDIPQLMGGMVSDEPWPDAAPALREGPPGARAATVEPPWVEASTMLSAEDAGSPAPPVSPDNLQIEKSLRRARAKADKIARARSKASSRQDDVAPVRQRAGGSVVAALDEPVPSFLHPAPPPGRWLGAASSGRALWVGVAVAVLLLVLQVLRHEGDAIVARQPAVRPVFTALCAVTGCELSALREISAFTIDGASFTREKNGDGYRLSFTLRNTAALPLAMPAVELSLLDMQEQTLVRRVLTPAEFGAPAVLAARSDRAASLPLALGGADAAGLPPIAGYRMLAFYP